MAIQAQQARGLVSGPFLATVTSLKPQQPHPVADGRLGAPGVSSRGQGLLHIARAPAFVGVEDGVLFRRPRRTSPLEAHAQLDGLEANPLPGAVPGITEAPQLPGL